jgi:hypothetical protein
MNVAEKHNIQHCLIQQPYTCKSPPICVRESTENMDNILKALWKHYTNTAKQQNVLEYII